MFFAVCAPVCCLVLYGNQLSPWLSGILRGWWFSLLLEALHHSVSGSTRLHSSIPGFGTHFAERQKFVCWCRSLSDPVSIICLTLSSFLVLSTFTGFFSSFLKKLKLDEFLIFCFYLRTGYVKRKCLTFAAICCWLHLVMAQSLCHQGRGKSTAGNHRRFWHST